MSTKTMMELQLATIGLTGRREKDICYLQEQIRVYGEDKQILPILKQILKSLLPAGSHKAVA